MLAWWTRYLPYALVLWLAKREAERFEYPALKDCVLHTTYPGEFIGYRKQPR